MRKINSVKHAKFILIMQEIEKIFSDESMFSEMDALDIHSKKLNAIHQNYQQTITNLERIIEEYHAESKVIRHLMLSKPIRKLKLKKIQPDKFKGIVNQVNSFIS